MVEKIDIFDGDLALNTALGRKVRQNTTCEAIIEDWQAKQEAERDLIEDQQFRWGEKC